MRHCTGMTPRDQHERLEQLCETLKGISLNDIPANKAAPIIEAELLAATCRVYAKAEATWGVA